jgi:hypothetical protein
VSAKKSSENKQWITIIVAMLALLGAALTAYFGYKGAIESAKLPIRATQTAEAKLTLVASSATPALAPTATRPPLTAVPTSIPLPMATLVLPTDTSVPTDTPWPTATPVPSTATPTRTSQPTPTSTATIDADPTVYDNFNDPAYNSSYNQKLWKYGDTYPEPQVVQQNGILVITSTSGSGGDLRMRHYNNVSLKQATSNARTFFEAKLMLGAEGEGSVHIKISDGSDSLTTVHGFSSCGIDKSGWASCYYTAWPPQEGYGYFDAEKRLADYESWHTFRIEIDPSTLTFFYYFNGQVVGSYTPVNAEALKQARYSFKVGVYANGEFVTGYVDDVRIGQLRQ